MSVCKCLCVCVCACVSVFVLWVCVCVWPQNMLADSIATLKPLDPYDLAASVLVRCCVKELARPTRDSHLQRQSLRGGRVSSCQSKPGVEKHSHTPWPTLQIIGTMHLESVNGSLHARSPVSAKWQKLAGCSRTSTDTCRKQVMASPCSQISERVTCINSQQVAIFLNTTPDS